MWPPSGAGIYFLRTTSQTTDLWKVAVDPATGRAAGEPVPVLTGFKLDNRLAVSTDGSSLACARVAGGAHLWLLERPANPRARESQTRALTTGTLEAANPSLSPDGQTAAFVAGIGGKTNVFTIGLADSAPRQITFLDNTCNSPTWSPDGKRIAFVSDHGGQARIWVVDVGEGSPRAYETTTPDIGGAVDWAPGAKIIYRQASARNFNILDPATGGQEALMPGTPAGWVFVAKVAPDGARIAFRWNRPPHRQIWLTARNGAAPQLLLDQGSAYPMGWSADGKWLYILDWSGTKTRVLRLSPAGGTPEPLFEVQFDVSQEDGSACPDGTKFVVTRIDSTSDVWLVENFDPDVQRP